MPQARLTANDDKQILQINNFEVADRWNYINLCQNLCYEQKWFQIHFTRLEF